MNTAQFIHTLEPGVVDELLLSGRLPEERHGNRRCWSCRRALADSEFSGNQQKKPRPRCRACIYAGLPTRAAVQQ